MMYSPRALVHFGAVLGVCIWPAPASAGCTVSGPVATCTGDLSGGVVFGAPVTTATISDLTTDIAPAGSSPGVEMILNTSKREADISVGFDGSGKAIVTHEDGIIVRSYGTKGDDGQEDNTGLGAQGGPGDNGLNAFSSHLDFDAGYIVGSGGSGNLLSVESLGGDGGTGGEGNGGDGPAGGGGGGRGGHGDAAVVVVTTGRFESYVGDFSAFNVNSVGGDGGAGGKGVTVTGTVTGGNGGEGGTGGLGSLTIQGGSVSGSTNAPLAYVESRGGDGGSGGIAISDAGGVTKGGLGGAGGDAGSAVADLLGGTFVQQGLSELLLVKATGGSGGIGGEARSDTIEDSTGGNGGAGGDGGSVSSQLSSATLTVEAGGGTAIFLQSQGGDGGDGGEGQTNIITDTSRGGEGASGGDGGTVTVTSQGPSITITSSATTSAIHGVRAESLGGGGGDGGDGTSILAGAGIGGDGGRGGSGGDVDVQLDADISTVSAKGRGLLARSYGGDGGDGGTGTTIGGPGLGGAAAGSGPGGEATVSFSGTIRTTGDEADAILVQSVGGFSGDAGSAGGFVAFGAGSQSAGSGGTVSVTTGAGSTISTTGDHATAVQAQSVGGGGGRGSSGDSGVVALGGDGSAGGHGGAVTVTTAGTISTSGDGGRVVHAASRGGGGGDGGATVGVTSIGGAGGRGGDGGSVTATNTADLTSTGDRATGLYAASVGGGGGTAHSTVGIVAIGGSGGLGGDGGSVTGSSTGNISTEGDRANGIFLYSIGGGGGDGSTAVSAAPIFSLALGGSGGGGGDGGAVSFDDNGATGYTITTDGYRAQGLSALSVGGGGGDGGTAVAVSAGTDFAISTAMSGSGGSGGSGGAVNVTTGAGIVTNGEHATALQAQSTGGGGGNAGTSVSSANGEGFTLSLAIGGAGGDGGDGGAVTVAATGDLATTGDQAGALFAQSHGGGGGHGGTTISSSVISGVSLNAAIGGKGGGGGSGGTVSVTGSGSTKTGGHVSPGVYAHSIGGGGGYSGTTVAGSAMAEYSLSASIGGSGGRGGDGGAVSVDISRTIATAGDISHGVAALSVGGGGGYSGATVGGSLASEMSINAAIGGKGGDGGDGGTVTLTTSGPISTEGHSSAAVTAHSVGGGGGAAHFTGALSGIAGEGAANIGVGGDGGVAGKGGAVTVNVAGDISTKGHNAVGIDAMSIGGGGGDSGTTVTGSLASKIAIGVTVGGSGGSSGTGGKVSVDTDSNISTAGEHSIAILAKSVSNGGGNAGLAVSGSGLSSGDVGITVGGSGGSGGKSGSVSVSSGGFIVTSGGYARGILAQSIAGGGGSAFGSVTGSALSTGNVGVTVGGAGGKGGTAGDVSVVNYAGITTTSHHAHGIQAQSHGGAGGNGGFAGQGSLTGGTVTGQFSDNVGGNGGDSGTAGDVTVTTHSTFVIKTEDFGSKGILAQSIGGNGGEGGSVYTGNLSFSKAGSAKVDVNVGGEGGNGARAGSATIVNANTIVTDGYRADGIHAQSIGGNGGNGGSTYAIVAGITATSSADVNVNVGGAGGAGATGGTASITNTGDITIGKGGSIGLYAQSVGGGGGSGGSAANINVGLTKDAPAGSKLSASVAVSVGGSGGGGSNGGIATVQNSGTITTAGKTSSAIFAHSVGGGGGAGGAASSTSINVQNLACKVAGIGGVYTCQSTEEGESENATEIEAELTVSVGGSGGAAGNGGATTATNSGALTTAGDSAHGIHVQSVGGGGGLGGQGGLGLEAWTTNDTIRAIDNATNNLTELPSFSSGSAAVGGSGGASGNGGAVTVNNSGLITTGGDRALGIKAQSVGGGGGDGAAGFGGIWTSVLVGGGGSGGGNGGKVDITLSEGGAIATSGEGSVGIFAQSVGGGGGTAGDVHKGISDPWANLNIGAGVGAQEDAGKGGYGGDIIVTTSAGITTVGEKAHGMMLQSVGGSGGVAGIDGALSGAFNNFAGSAGDAGDGGDITATIGAPITVSGEQAHAIFAQSVSGTTGEDDTSGSVTITINADVAATGKGGRAILAQSASHGDGNGTIAITIAEGATVMTAANGAQTIGLFDGKANTIVNNGTLIQAGGVNGGGHVVRTNGTAALTITNNGTMSGAMRSELKSSGSSGGTQVATAQPITLTNNAGAMLGLGWEMNLAGGEVANAGTMSAGGIGTIGTSLVHGNISQTSDGTMTVDIAFGQDNDLIALTGATLTAVLGSVSPTPVSDTPLPSSGTSGSFPILQSGGAIDIGALTVASTATVDYSLDQTSFGSQGHEVLLGYKVDYTPWNGDVVARSKVPDEIRSTINANHTSAGDHVDDLIASQRSGALGDPGADAFVQELALSLLTTETVAELVDVYDRFAPGEIFAQTDAALFSSLRFSDNLNSCPAIGATGAAVFTRDGSCIWASVSGTAMRRQRNNLSIDYDETVYGISGGGQAEFAESWFAGLAFGYENSELSNSRIDAEGDRFQAGAVLKKELGATTLTGSLSGGISNYDLSRELLTPNGLVLAASDPTTAWIAGHARVAHVFGLSEAFYLKPWFDLGVQQVWQDGYTETGAGGYGLVVGDFSDTVVTLNPMLEIGASFNLGGMATNARLKAGMLALVGETDHATDVQFIGAGGSTPSFTVADDANQIFADLGAAIEAQVHERVTIGASVDTLLSGNQQEYRGSARVNILF